MGIAKKTPELSPLQEKFIKTGLEGLREPEILELLLSLGTPDRDYHALARRIVSRLKTIKGLMNTPKEQIQKIPGVSSRDIFALSVVRDLFHKIAIENILERPIYETGRIVFEYLYYDMRELSNEQCKMICLDKSKRIIGTMDLLTIKADTSIAQSSRAVIEHVIKNGARYFIVVHNHLSGDPRPTNNDKDITRDLVFAGMIIQIRLLDHVIIGKDSFFSFSNEGMIEEYEAEFHELKLRGTSESKRRLAAARKAADKD
jgi:DNA repair protein RadC